MKNKYIKSVALLLFAILLSLLVSCGTIKSNSATETLSNVSTESILEIGEYPNSTGWVNDFAGIFKQEDIDKMNELLTDLEKKTTAEVTVATVTSLNGKSIETYASELFNSWGIGKKDLNNGLLFLIALNEKKFRIETGDGLQKIITDAIAKQILDEIALPSFKKGDYSQGSYEVIKKLSEEILATNK